MATSEELGEAYNRGRSAGEQAALNKQPRSVSPGMYSSYLGPYQGDPTMRNSFDSGFYYGYDAAAAGLGPAKTQVLKDITKQEQGKANNPYGAQQTELALDYLSFDALVRDDLALDSSPGGPDFLARWKDVKNEFDSRNINPMSDLELADSRIKLEGFKAERDAILAGGGFGTYSLPAPDAPTPAPTYSTWETLPSLDLNPAKAPGALVKPAAPGAAPVAAGLFGLSRNATIGLGVVALAAIGGAIYYTTRDEHKNMVLGPDGIWRPKPTPPKGVV